MTRLAQAIFNRRMLACLLLGFSSGLPLTLLVTLQQVWLYDSGVTKLAVGGFALARLPYSWKFLWAPLLDRFQLGSLGRHRGWAFATQLALCLSLAAFGLFQPAEQIEWIFALTVVVALIGATQDIVLDAYRREVLPDAELGLGTSLFVNAYRVAGLVPGSLAYVLADHLPWKWVFPIVALFMLVGVAGAWVAPRLPPQAEAPTTLRQAVVGPFREFFMRGNLRAALLLLLFMVLYKIGDNLATSLLQPFYLDLGFTKTEIGAVVKTSSLVSMVVGSLIGGLVMVKVGINRALWLFGVVQLVSILGFAALAEVGKSLPMLAGAVVFEYLGIGLGTSAFVAFLARATSKQFSATQYALFSSFVALPGSFTGIAAASLIDTLGYTRFFLLCTAMAIPGMLLLFKVAPWSETQSAAGADDQRAVGGQN